MSEKKVQDKIKEMEEEIRKLKDEQKEEDIEGVTQGALHGLGKIIPGFSELFKGLEKSEAFQERLKAADAEIEHQLEKASPLKKVEGTRGSIIPPKSTLKVSRTTLREESASQPPRREVIADVFDEGDYLKVIAELPGIDEKDIKARVKGNQLVISAQAAGRQYYKEIELPCLVKEELNLSYKNGILQVRIKK